MIIRIVTALLPTEDDDNEEEEPDSHSDGENEIGDEEIEDDDEKENVQELEDDNIESQDVGVDLKSIIKEIIQLPKEECVLSAEEHNLLSGVWQCKGWVHIKEFRAFMGLIIMRNIWGLGPMQLMRLFRLEAYPIFSATLARERFKIILRHLPINRDFKTEKSLSSWGRGKISSFSYLLSKIQRTCRELITQNRGEGAEKEDFFDFGHGLAMSLINPHLYSRELTNANRSMLLKMHLATGDHMFLDHVMGICETEQSLHSALKYRDTNKEYNGPKKRCGECMREIYVSSSIRDKRDRVNGLTKVKTRCDRCGLFKCSLKHLVKLCSRCVKI